MMDNVVGNLERYEAATTAADLADTALVLVDKYMADIADLYPREVRSKAMAMLGAKISHRATVRGR